MPVLHSFPQTFSRQTTTASVLLSSADADSYVQSDSAQTPDFDRVFFCLTRALFCISFHFSTGESTNVIFVLTSVGLTRRVRGWIQGTTSPSPSRKRIISHEKNASPICHSFFISKLKSPPDHNSWRHPWSPTHDSVGPPPMADDIFCQTSSQ